MKNKKEELQERIEEARIAMDLALKEGIDDEWAYHCSIVLDELIERYIEIEEIEIEACENEKTF